MKTSKLATLREVLEEAIRVKPLVAFKIDTKPVPASRARVTRWGTTYHLKPYKNWLEEANGFIKKAKEVTQSPLIVLIEVFGKKAKTTKRPFPRGDVDNFAKGTLDAINHHKGVWKDDDQVVGLWVSKQYAEPGEERTEVNIYELRD